MLTVDGISTTRTHGSFRTEEYYSRISKRRYIQWDYRDSDGVLHSGVARDITAARKVASKYGYGG